MQDLWNFALELYARPGVENACLELQDSGCDVCLLLTCAWLERRGARCLDERLSALRALADPWQRSVVSPLRQTRREWRTAASQDAELAVLRERIRNLELQAEKVLLERLQAAAEGWTGEDARSDWLHRLSGKDSVALQVLRDAVAAL